MGSFGAPFWTPKSSQKGDTDLQSFAVHATCVCVSVWIELQDAPRRFQDRPRWLQDPPKRAPGGDLELLLGALGPYLGGLGARDGSFWGRFGVFWGSIHGFDPSLRFNDAIRRFDLIRFVASSWSRFGSLWVVWSRFGAVLDRLGVRFVDSIHRSDSMMQLVVSIR